jgi:predicted DCC family thiol-disulfide oxidoreductase YuxK
MTSFQSDQTHQSISRWGALPAFWDRYSLDVRSLALLRIGLALTILTDLWTRAGDLVAHYSDLGVLPRAVLNDGLLKPGHWSLHALSGQPVVQGLLFWAAAIAALAMLFGYHSRLATIASWILLISLHNRNPLLIFAADDVLRAVMFWAMFLPLGAAYSVDRAMNTSPRPIPLRILSGATLALMAQQCFIYMFSAVFKTTNEAWWPDGTAVYYTLSYDQYVTPLGHFLLNLGPLLTVFTLVTLAVEWVGPLLLWSPVRNDACRLAAVIIFIGLHLGFGLTLNLGIFPFLSIITWLAFIPTSAWEKLGDRIYGPNISSADTPGSRHTVSQGLGNGLSPQRTGLRIFYDADCGFCKKVVHLIRMLLVLPHTPLATAQSIPEINEAMETQNSWVIVDWKGQHHYKFEGIAYVVSLSPVFGWFAAILRWYPVMSVGTNAYEWIATHRKVAGRFTRPFKFRPLTLSNPNWLSALAFVLLALTCCWNLRSIVTHRDFVESSQPAVSVVRRIVGSQSAQRLDWISQITRLDQSWSIFAPGPPKDDGWHVITGVPLEAGNNDIDVLRPNQNISFEKPTLGNRDRFYKNMQWRTFYINLNRRIGQTVFPHYSAYLCRQSAHQGHPLKSMQVYFMDETTAAPGKPQPIEKKFIGEQACPIP